MTLRLVVLGLSITSSWGNGHATTYRGLVKELHAAGHEVLFLERDVSYYASHRDLPIPPYGRTALYRDLHELRERHAEDVRRADLVLVGSYVPEGVEVGHWVTRTARGRTAFYDIDTPVTLAKLARGDHDYLHPDLVPRYDAYLSFTGGPTLDRLKREHGAREAWPLYCSVDPDHYGPVDGLEARYDLGYLGTYSDDRQPTLDRLLIEPARSWSRGRFAVAGPMYPEQVAWPRNVQRIEHLPPHEHRGFYNAQRFTLNVTRADMVQAGWSPSVRLFEAAACGVPILSDAWRGIDHFFEPNREILVVHTSEDVVQTLRGMREADRRALGQRARERVLREHTAAHRARTLESYAEKLLARGPVAHA